VRFDDRLLTVLNQPAGDRRDIAVRWRQLVDLVARAGSSAASPAVANALDSIRADAPEVDESLRAAAARAVAALPLPLSLLEFFASDRLSVSAPVLAAATLDPLQWQAVMSAADEETRRFIEALHPEIRPPPAPAPQDMTESLVESPCEEPPPALPAPSLHEVVERIERRRRSRSMMKHNSGLSASADSPGLFRWECGPGGDIAWVDGAPRGAVIGRSIARVQDGEQLDPDVVRAFMLRAPFRDATLSVAGDGPLSGEWKISGVPAFEPTDGRFAGYRGIALREQDDTSESGQPTGLLADPDSVRELVHEIKTPLNAIMGFAEIIEGQYLGPADERYRDRAQEIVRQARLLLTAIDDLDFAAMIHSSRSGEQRRVNLGELVERMAPAVRDLARDRGVEIAASRATRDTRAATEPELADRLIFRMCSAVIEQAQPDEHLRLTVERAGDRSRVSMTSPVAWSELSEEQLLGGDPSLERGFSLRLVRGLARLAGVDLTARQGSISLLFPRA
jgi:hypothetical protein